MTADIVISTVTITFVQADKGQACEQKITRSSRFLRLTAPSSREVQLEVRRNMRL